MKPQNVLEPGGDDKASKLILLAVAVLAGMIYSTPVNAATLQLLSARDPSIALPAGGNGDSVAPILTPDSRFTVFTSAANDLTPGDNHQVGLNVFLRDRTSNTTTLVSSSLTGFGGGNGSSTAAGVSTNGRLVVFVSAASDLVSGDTNGATDIFVRDLQTGTTRLVSASTNGSVADGPSSEPVMTPDGRFIAFVSFARNLVPGVLAVPNVFMRDLAAGTTVLANGGLRLSSDSRMATPVITPDGRNVAFVEYEYIYDSGYVTTTSASVIYLCDLVQGQTLVTDPALNAYHPAISDDGRYLALKTGASLANAIVLYDGMSGLAQVVRYGGVASSDYRSDPFGPEMTADGRFIVYTTFDGTNSNDFFTSVHLWDGTAKTDTLVSVARDGRPPTNTVSQTPSLTPDGRFVVFVSNATNLVTTPVASGIHVYLRNLQSGITQLVDADTNGVGSTDNKGAVPTLSDDGRFVGFCSPDGRLVSGDNNHAYDVFVRDMVAGSTDLISSRDASVLAVAGNSSSSFSSQSISADGRKVAFASFADDLVSNDSNGTEDVFVSDRSAGTNILVSIGTDGQAASGGFSCNALISADGRFVAFLSSATNLIAGHTNRNLNLFRRDLQTKTTILLSVSTNGISAADGDCSAPALSADGRYVVFASRAKNLAPSIGNGTGLNTYWLDVVSGTPVLVATNAGGAFAPSLSANGQVVAYGRNSGSSKQLWVWNALVATNLYGSIRNISSAAVSPNGQNVAYQFDNSLILAGVKSGSELYKFATPIPIRSAAQWSADSRFFAFAVGMHLPFRVQYSAQGTNSVSLSWTGISGASYQVQFKNNLGDSTWQNASYISLSISNGKYTQTMRATGSSYYRVVGILPGGISNIDIHTTNHVYLCDLFSGTVTLVSINRSRTGGGDGNSDWPAVSQDGRFVAFRSFARDLAPVTSPAVPNIFVFNRLTGSNTLLTAQSPAQSWSAWLSKPTIAGDGPKVAFQSWAACTPADLNGGSDIYWADTPLSCPLINSEPDRSRQREEAEHPVNVRAPSASLPRRLLLERGP